MSIGQKQGHCYTSDLFIKFHGIATALPMLHAGRGRFVKMLLMPGSQYVTHNAFVSGYFLSLEASLPRETIVLWVNKRMFNFLSKFSNICIF